MAIVVLTIGSLRFFGHRNFAEFVKKMDMVRVAALIEILKEEYDSSDGWKKFEKDPGAWHEILRYLGRIRPGHMKIPPTHHLDARLEPEPLWFEGRPPPGLPPPPSADFLELGHRIFLMDENKQFIAGRMVMEDAHLQEITMEGKTVGWVGINPGERHLSPPELNFIERQNELFSFIGLGIFALTALISFFLSRHLLSRIKELTDGTRSLTSRDFSRRIQVRARDELGQLAADFNIMARTLEQYEEMQKQWISDISHELRTPLAVLRGEIEAMQDGVREINREAIESLYAEVVHLTRIVSDLHELALADSGTLHLDRKQVNPLNILKDTLSLYRTRFDVAGIDIRENISTAPEVFCMGDSHRLAQLYANLLENVIRYVDRPGFLKIEQNVTENKLGILFKDSGPGAPDSSLDRLFDRLYRVDSARCRSEGGSGLGLAICKSIAESHGGKISAHRAETGGLEIRLVLPICAC